MSLQVAVADGMEQVRFAEPDPDIGFVPVTAPTPLRGTLALSQSLAFGGNNSILLFSKGDRPCP